MWGTGLSSCALYRQAEHRLCVLQGSSVGHSFEQLRFMVDAVHDRSRIGVCLDTCHMFAAGYDISTRDGYNDVMAQFGDIVGWQYLKGECSVLSIGQCLPRGTHMHFSPDSVLTIQGIHCTLAVCIMVSVSARHGI